MRKKLLIATIGFVVAFALVACGDKDNDNEQANNEPSNENNQNENNQDENNAAQEGEEKEPTPEYDIISQDDITNIDYTDLGDNVETIHIHHSNYEVFDYMSMSGDINDIIVEDNKYYFTNASRYYSHDVDSLEREDMIEPDRNRMVNITEDYTVFIPDMGKFVLTIFNRETKDLKEVDLESSAEYSTHIFPYSDGNLTLVGVIQEVEEEMEIDLYAINLDTGEKELVLENYTSGPYELQEAHFDEKNFYVFDGNGNLHAFDRNNYDEVWTFDNGDLDIRKYNLYQDDDHLYVTSQTEESLYKISKIDGSSEVIYNNPEYPISGVHLIQDDNTLVAFGESTEHIGFIDLDSGEVMKELQLSNIYYLSETFNNKLYMFLTTQDDDDRKLLEIPYDPNGEIRLIDIEAKGYNSSLGMHVIDGKLHVTGNRHYYQIKE